MYWNGKKIYTFDIETTGLSYNDKFLCGVTYNPTLEANWINETLKGVTHVYNSLEKEETLLITYNGENYRGGFDFPWLRTQFALDNRPWVFKDFYHLDLLPLVKKYIYNDLLKVRPPTKSSLKKANLVELAEANNIDYKTIDKTYADLEKLDKTDWLDYTREKLDKKRYGEQDIYQTFFDPAGNEHYISGADSKKLYEAGKKDKVITHCVRDVQRLYKIAELSLDMLPEWEIKRNINRL